jgi:hypothetical protein
VKLKTKVTIAIVLGTILFFTPSIHARRYMERLGRGVVAVRSSSSQVFISWRLLGLDPSDIGFNLYRSTDGGIAVKLNSSALTGGTNYTDGSANLSKANTYYVKPVISGVEQAASSSFTLAANHATEPVVRVPLRSGGVIKFVWVGDLDGDGEYDYVLDRQTSPQTIEAYKRDGTFLWTVDMGPNSENQNNIEGGSSTIDVGHNDGVTVFDLDSDGKAEVIVRAANGVTFGDGTTLSESNNNKQFISVLNGMTGAELARITIPQDYISDGPMYARLGIGYLNGSTPSIVAYMKNRIGSGDFNLMICAWDYLGGSLTQKWMWKRGSQNCPDGHSTRIVDVDGDGTDEICEIGFVLNGDGTLRYSLGPAGIVHGDRFHIGKFDLNRAGLQGYGIQQSNPSGLLEYYYDAATGEILWEHFGAVGDVGRGMVADIDSRYSGYEVWSFSGLYNGPANTLTEPNTSLRPWPAQQFWWDGDLLCELLNDAKFEKWDPLHPTTTSKTPRLLTISTYGAIYNYHDPTFYADIFGDWRTEAIFTDAAYTQLIIFTTWNETTYRIYTMAHNPEYRNQMTVKGYMQPAYVDYYMGSGMSTPPHPQIKVLYGDLTGDNNVDINDVSEFSKVWLATDCNNVELDWNGDCIINLYEFSLLAKDWLE